MRPELVASGQVIGINEQIAFQSGRNQRLGFAAPIDTAASVMEQLQATGKVTYAYTWATKVRRSPATSRARSGYR